MKQKLPDQLFEELLLYQVLQGDKKAFGLLYRRWNSRLVKYAVRILKNQADAEDVVQEAWIATSKAVRRMQVIEHFGPWIRRIVYHKAIDLIRKNKRPDRPIEVLDNPENPQIEQILMAMKRMPEHQQTILSMYYLEEMPIAEIAYVMDLPPGTIKSRLFHARNKLKLIVNKYHYEK